MFDLALICHVEGMEYFIQIHCYEICMLCFVSVKNHGLYKGAASPWPPLRLPGPIHSNYAMLRKILHCRSMHAILFTILYKVCGHSSFCLFHCKLHKTERNNDYDKLLYIMKHKYWKVRLCYISSIWEKHKSQECV